MISSLMFIWLRSTLPQFASYLSSFKTDPSIRKFFQYKLDRLSAYRTLNIILVFETVMVSWIVLFGG